MMPLGFVLLALVGAAPDEAVSQPAGRAAPTTSPKLGPGLLPTAGALVPGFLLHGSGHWLAGDRSTAWKLLALEGSGLLVTATGFLPIVFSGASRRIVGPATALTVAGLSLTFISWLADLYGAAGGARLFGSPALVLPYVEGHAGLATIYDPQFTYRAFSAWGAELRLGSFRLAPSVWVAIGDDTQRYRLEAAYRLLGAGTHGDAGVRDGSFLEAQTNVMFRRLGSAGFSVLTLELGALGRYDMGRMSPSLAGSFAELGLGWALELYDYRATREQLGEDTGELLLGHFGYGVYLGNPQAMSGEVMVYYGHRHDDFAAGSSTNSVGDGIPGHVGLAGHCYFTPSWGVALDLQLGSAWLASLSAQYRYGGTP